MKNQLQHGDAIAVIAPSGGFVDGRCYQIGQALFGVASYTCLVGATGELWLKGIFALAKPTTQVWALGDIVYWDDTNHWCSNVSTDGRASVLPPPRRQIQARPAKFGSMA
jgi:predicted RecA/RadA family phage recombinase